MKLYLASSWKNTIRCVALKEGLEAIDMEVNLFCFPGHRTKNFNWNDLAHSPKDDIVSYMKKYSIVKDAYKEDRGYLDSCDALIMVYPAGISTHFQMGTALGQGKPTFIFGDLTTLKPEVWYMGVTGIFWTHQLEELFDELTVLQESYDKNSTSL